MIMRTGNFVSPHHFIHNDSMIVRLCGSMVALAAAGLLGFFVFILGYPLIDNIMVHQQQVSVSSIVYDDAGNELFSFKRDKQEPIVYEQVPRVVIDAFIAAEDRAFFRHSGFSLKGILRSILVNMYYGRVVQGASTITQQVARLLFLSPERTWWRKIKEMIIALQLEWRLGKEQIMELYLNNVYFGQGIYGVQAACKRLWNKSVEHVTAAEAASLAAVAKSARFYSPLNAPLSARQRRNTILRIMHSLGMIDEDAWREGVNSDLDLYHHVSGSPIRLYLQEWIRSWAEQQFGKEAIYTQGLKIKTTINLALQEAAEKSFERSVKKLRTELKAPINGGLVSMHVETGGIRAMVGGFDFRESQFNRAFQAYRQLGSSFKPMLYALALESGFSLDTVMVDEPLRMIMDDGQVWEPRNWNRRFEGSMTLARALTFSNNIVSIKLFMLLGAARVMSWIKKFGITRELSLYPSAALGTAHGSVAEDAAAFNVFANNGVYVKPHLIEWVKNKLGKKVWVYELEKHVVLDSKVCSKMVKALMIRMNLASKRFDRHLIPTELIGKTGSTNGAATTWFVGSTPTYTTAVYVGRDDNKPMGNVVYASATAFPIWIDLVKEQDHPVQKFYLDKDLHDYRINLWTGQSADEHDPESVVLLR